MTTTSARRRASSARSKRRASTPLVAHQRKKEIIGLMLMVLSALVALAMVTYSTDDKGVVDSFDVESVFDPSQSPATNLLGPLGAVIAYLLVPRFIGYFSLVFPGVVFAWAYVQLRRRPSAVVRFRSVLAAFAAFVLSTTAGWVLLVWGVGSTSFSGAWGQAVARWLIGFLGKVGGGGILLLLIGTIALLATSRDIQSVLDKLEDWWRSKLDFVRLRIRDWIHEWRERREERRTARVGELDQPTDAPPETRTRSKEGVASPPVTSSAVRAPTTALVDGRKTAYASDSMTTEFDAPDDALSMVEPEPVHFDKTGAVSIHVQEQIREEKADRAPRRSEMPVASPPYRFPPLRLLEETDQSRHRIDYSEIEENNQVLLDKLATYSIEITNINAIVGPTVTMYELTPAPGVKISRITALENDLAMAMAARGIRMIAPIPGKSAVGVEIPNRHRELVRVRDIIGTARFQDNHMELPVAIGKAIDGEVFVEDLTKMPHLLIAGATGSGKSVGLNTLIVGLLYACHPSNLKFVMIDPKKIELQQYAQIFDHFAAMPPHSEDPIITDFTEALGVLKCCEKEMELRYDLLSDAGVRGIKEYNKRFATGSLDTAEGHRHLPYIVVIVDELADLMMTAGKDIEGPIARLAQMARAVGIHLVLATQRPSVDVITGLIKANFPSRIAYQVASKVDSRTILDQNGAEGLVGNGDLLYMNGSRVVRLQGPFVSVEEVEEVMRFIGDQTAAGPYILPSIEESASGVREVEVLEDTDDLFDEAARIIVRSQQGSVSLLQRRLSVGYTRAARIVDQLEDAGVVGPFEGSKARRVLIESEPELDQFLASRK